MREKVRIRGLVPALSLAFLFLATAPPTAGQIRVERDANGLPLITNKGSVPRAPSPKSAGGAPAKKSRKDSPERASVERKLRDACDRRGLDYRLVACLVEAESGFNHFTMSRKGAVGLMQLMPGTAKRFGCNDPWNLEQNIEGGTRFLEFLHDQFSGDVPLVLAGYNAGEGAVMKYSRKIPPYSETVRYVFTILERYGSRSLVQDARASLASPADYDRYYTPGRGHKVVTRTYYMYFNAQGTRCFTDAPPSGIECHRVVYKDE